MSDGVVRQPCEWRRSGLGHVSPHVYNYSSCVPPVAACLDGRCDTFEQLEASLCPQDCYGEDRGAQTALQPLMFCPDITHNITCGETSSRRLIESQLKFSPCGRLPPTHTATRRKLKPVFRNIQFLEDKGFVLFDQHCHSWNIILCNDLGVQFSFY